MSESELAQRWQPDPTLYKKLTYDPVKDFAPNAMLAHLPFVLLVNPSLPVLFLLKTLNARRNSRISWISEF